MKQVDYSAFNGRDLQNIHSLLIVVERAGVTDIRYLRQSIADFTHRLSIDARRRKKEKRPENTPVKKKDQKEQVTIKQSNIPCPECHKGYLQVKILDGVTYTACPQCYKSVEFK